MQRCRCVTDQTALGKGGATRAVGMAAEPYGQTWLLVWLGLLLLHNVYLTNRSQTLAGTRLERDHRHRGGGGKMASLTGLQSQFGRNIDNREENSFRRS
jgi:shikimate 5-dehydrogenase